MWSEEMRSNLYKELEVQLDNKNFFGAKAYNNENVQINKKNSSNMAYAKAFVLEETPNYENTVKGMAFSNKIEISEKQNTIDDLSMENRKIYKIADLLSANLVETIVIPYNIKPTSLALVKKIDWKDVLFADVGTAFGMIKSKFKL